MAGLPLNHENVHEKLSSQLILIFFRLIKWSTIVFNAPKLEKITNMAINYKFNMDGTHELNEKKKHNRQTNK